MIRQVLIYLKTLSCGIIFVLNILIKMLKATTPTGDGIENSGEGLQNPLSWCAVNTSDALPVIDY